MGFVASAMGFEKNQGESTSEEKQKRGKKSVNKRTEALAMNARDLLLVRMTFVSSVWSPSTPCPPTM